MSERKSDSVWWVWVVVIAGVLISLVFACFFGALAGWLAGRAAGADAARQYDYRFVPRMPDRWRMPDLPELQVPETLPEIPGRDFGREFVEGALIREVVLESPAEDAGLLVGDIITAVNDTLVDDVHPLVTIIGDYQPGDRIRLTVWRTGSTQTIRLTLGEHPDRPGRPYMGITYTQISMPGLFDPPDD